MSHELRTPLNSLLILANLLAENGDKNLSDQQVEYANTIYQSGRDLLGLIDQILDLSKIEAGRMQIERRRVPLGELRLYLERAFRPLAQQKNLDFGINIADETPPTITTDPQRLEQILKNLLSNAFKFTESGEVEVRVRVDKGGSHYATQALQSAQTVLALAVSDTGIGIPTEKQQLIFEAFQQADASTSRTYGGTGLGLTISRELARLLGGEIHLKSEAGVGSTFTLYLPITEEDRRGPPPDEDVGAFERSHHPERYESVPALAPLSESENAADLTGRKILVVDDDIRNLFAVTTLLEHRGARVVPARSGKEALDALDHDVGIEMVLMDVMMPEMDGYAATREIRKRERIRHLPVIALTAKAMPGDRDKTIEAGCNDFVPKPVEPNRLLDTMLRWLPPRATGA
jgi:CheY-like chemotaxis protein